MPDVLQQGTRQPSFFTVGDLDFNPAGWTPSAFVVVGGDFTGNTCMPHHGAERSPIYTDTDQDFVADDRAAPDADFSRNLAFNLSTGTVKGPFFYSVGVITGVWTVARAPDGETITAQWYIAGVAVGSQITFDNVDHKATRLPDIFYGIANWIRGDSLTLRVWGGLFHIGTLLLLPRPTQTHLAIDIIDPAATVDSIESDSLSTSGGDVAVATTDFVTGISQERFLEFDATADIAEQSLDLLYIVRSGPDLTTDTARYKNFSPYVSGDSGSTVKNMTWEIWINDIKIGDQPEWSGVDPQGSVCHTVWCPSFHNQYNGLPAKVSSATHAQTALIVDNGDTIGIRVDNNSAEHIERAFDMVHVGRRIDDMRLVFGAEPAFDEYDPSDTFDIEWEYIGQATQGGSYVDRTSLFTSVDGLVYDSNGNLVLTETGIGTTPWTVDVSLVGSGESFYAFVRGNLPDGSYAYTGWQFDVTGGVGQIYRRL